MHPSLSSLINKTWLRLILPVLMVMIAGMVIAGHDALKGQSWHPLISPPHEAQIVTLTMSSPEIVPASGQAPQSESEQPLFFLSSVVEASEMSPEGILALLGFTLLCAGALTLEQLKAHTLTRRHQTAFGPFTGPEHAPLFILLQVFRL